MDSISEDDLNNIVKLFSIADEHIIEKIIRKGDLNNVKFLINNSLEIKEDNLFIIAIQTGHLDIAKFLFEIPHYCVRLQLTEALQLAIKKGYFDIIKLVCHNIIYNENNYIIAFQNAILGNNLNIVKFIFEQYTKNIDQIHDIFNPIGSILLRANDNYALRTASEKCSQNIIKFLLEIDIVPLSAIGVNSCLADFVIKNAIARKHTEIIEIFERLGLIMQNLTDNNILTKAVKNNDINDVNFIINTNKANNIRITEEDSLYAAMIRGYIEIAIILIENDIGIHYYNDISLAMASASGNYNIVKLLIEHGANVQANKNKALQNAIIFKHLELERLLIEHDANREEAIKYMQHRQYYAKSKIIS